MFAKISRAAAAAAVIPLLCIASPVSATLTVKHLATDAEMVALLSDTIFVAEGRIGDRGGAATFELDLGQSAAAPAATAQYNWQSGVLEPFTITFDNATGLVRFVLGGNTLQYTTQFGQFGDIFVRTRATDAGTSVVVQNLVLDGETIYDQSSAVGAGLDILWISGGVLRDGFTLTGVAALSWTGTPPSQSRLAFQVKVAKLGLIGVEGKSWGRIKALYR